MNLRRIFTETIPATPQTIVYFLKQIDVLVGTHVEYRLVGEVDLCPADLAVELAAKGVCLIAADAPHWADWNIDHLHQHGFFDPVIEDFLSELKRLPEFMPKPRDYEEWRQTF